MRDPTRNLRRSERGSANEGIDDKTAQSANAEVCHRHTTRRRKKRARQAKRAQRRPRILVNDARVARKIAREGKRGELREFHGDEEVADGDDGEGPPEDEGVREEREAQEDGTVDGDALVEVKEESRERAANTGGVEGT